jgi:hypothetical protein
VAAHSIVGNLVVAWCQGGTVLLVQTTASCQVLRLTLLDGLVP